MATEMYGATEFAMTHVAGPSGQLAACHRPEGVRDIVGRLHNWRDSRETCKSCVAADAVRIVSGVALCSRCRENRQHRIEGMEHLNRLVTRGMPAVGDGFQGHAIVCDQWSLDLGGFIERIRPEALNRTLSESIDVRALWNHDSGITLARLSANTLAFRKDDIGMAVQFVPPTWAASHIETVDRGDVRSMSFGFRTIDDEWDYNGKVAQRDVTDMRVSEFSIVNWPAYPQTDVSVSRNMRVTRARSMEWVERWHKIRTA